VLTTLGFSRAMAGALVFSKEPPDVLGAICRGIWRLGGLPELLVSDREGALHAGGGRPSIADSKSSTRSTSLAAAQLGPAMDYS
jgi:hypothetical protein